MVISSSPGTALVQSVAPKLFPTVDANTDNQQMQSQATRIAHVMVCRFTLRAFFWTPNAGAHLLPEAGATQERTLEAVRCSALLGALMLVCENAIVNKQHLPRGYSRLFDLEEVINAVPILINHVSSYDSTCCS